MNLTEINPLRKGMIAVLVLLVSGVILLWLWPGKYKIPVSEAASLAADIKGIHESDWVEFISSSGNRLMIVDIRNENLYNASHLENAINIPAEKVFEKRNLRKLRKNPVVVYGSSVYEAHQVALLLIMTGVDATPLNVDYIYGKEASLTKPDESDSVYNYREIFKSFEIKEPAPVVIKVPVPKPQGC